MSRIAFFGPSARVLVTYCGRGWSSSHSSTVFFTLKRGRCCSSASAVSLLLWVRICSRRILDVFARVYTRMDGKSMLFTAARMVLRFSANSSLLDLKSVFAFRISFFSSFNWKSRKDLSSKHPLLGILNCRNRGMISECLHFVRKSMRRVLRWSLLSDFWY